VIADDDQKILQQEKAVKTTQQKNNLVHILIADDKHLDKFTNSSDTGSTRTSTT
jgi:hypothetical protein